MDCGICSNAFGSRRQPVCVSCSRAALYAERVGQVHTLLDREGLIGKVETVLTPPSQLHTSAAPSASQIVDVTESARKLEHERHKNQLSAIDSRLALLREQQETLRHQIDAAKETTASRRLEHSQRRRDLSVARQASSTENVANVKKIKADSDKFLQRLDKTQYRIARQRKAICNEAARLAGLPRKRSRARDGSSTIQDVVTIGRIAIFDLRELNTVHPDVINASLASVTRLLVLTAYYLGVRLPAEVVVQHDDYPRPAIFSLQSSYKIRGKERFLAINKPLPLLAKEDDTTYKLFVEGLVLLAYDIAWLCRVQGSDRVNTWEDLCNMGANLYGLLVEDAFRPMEKGLTDDGKLSFGAFSCAGAMTAAARERLAKSLDGWSLPPLKSMQDRLRSHLLTEMSGAEWDLLEAKEWEEEREDERAVLVGGARWSLNSGGMSKMGVSYMTATPDAEDAPEKGWMKLKSRSREDA